MRNGRAQAFPRSGAADGYWNPYTPQQPDLHAVSIFDTPWRVVAVLAFAIALSGIKAVSGAQPAEAAKRAYHPTAVCSSINSSYRSVRVGDELAASGYAAEQVAVSYTIRRWNSNTRSWYTYLRHSYAGRDGRGRCEAPSSPT